VSRPTLYRWFPSKKARLVASVVTRIALSHALIPDDDPELFHAELRHAAGLDIRTHKSPRRDRRRSREEVR
jgi:AcrR family transcriptional regulator